MAGSAHRSSRTHSMRIAYCGMLCALSVVLMLTGGLIPIMTYVSPLAAGVLLLPILLDFGAKSAWTAWGATALIVLMLGVDKEAAFFYLFLGYYPVLKWRIDRLPSKPVRLCIKAAIFASALAVMYSLLAFLLHMEAVLADFAELGQVMTAVFFVLMVVCLLMYDRLLLPLMYLYDKKLRPRFKFLNR